LDAFKKSKYTQPPRMQVLLIYSGTCFFFIHLAEERVKKILINRIASPVDFISGPSSFIHIRKLIE
jgi:hypothetical protein